MGSDPRQTSGEMPPSADTRLGALVEAQRGFAAADLDAEQLVQLAVDHTRSAIGAPGVLVELLEGEETIVVGAGGTAATHLGRRLPAAASLGRLSMDAGQPISVADSELDQRVDRETCRSLQARSLAAAPLLAGNATIGALCISAPRPGVFDSADLVTLQFLASLLTTELETASGGAGLSKPFGKSRAEGDLGESESRFRVIFDSAPIGIALVDLKDQAIDVNPTLQHQLGYTADELRGRRVAELSHPDDMAAGAAAFQALAAGEIDRYQAEKRYIRKDGTALWGHLSAALIRDGQGRPAFAVRMIEDITDRITAREALERSETKFRALTEHSHDLIVLMDGDGLLTYASPSVTRVLGHTPDGFIGRSIFDLIHPDDRGGVRELIAGTLRSEGEAMTHRFRWARVDGSYSWLDGTARNLLHNPAVGAVVVNTRDVTEAVEAERRLQEYSLELQRSNQELQEFAYVASHDLQEPLRKIQAFGDRLRAQHADVLGDTGRDYLERMQNAASRMQALIRELLALSRVTSEGQPFVRLDLSIIAAEVVGDLESVIEEAGGEVVIGGMPEVDGDPFQIRQLLQNLIANALKFHPEGVPPQVSVSAQREGKMVKLEVADHGIGFEEQYGEKIFAPFQRLHGRSTYEGTGMGLAICRKIAHRHGGTIRATGRPGEGATFTVTLPFTRSG